MQMSLVFASLAVAALGAWRVMSSFNILPPASLPPTTVPTYRKLQIDYPRPPLVCTLNQLPKGTRIIRAPHATPAGYLVPRDARVLSRGKRVTLSDPYPVIGSAEMITDGEKSFSDMSFVQLSDGKQWAQIDLGASCRIYAIAMWHEFGQEEVHRDVVVQVSDDPAFKENVRTVFNNDQDNSLGLGTGKDLEYFETWQGKVVEVDGVRGRYVRVWGNGPSVHGSAVTFVEIEIHGVP